MARGRMLNKTVSFSTRFAALPDDTCRLLATWTIPHLDKRGVFYGEPAIVRSVVFPMREDITTAQVAGYLQAMVDAGLIRLFHAGGHTWQVWPGFIDNQKGLHTDRESSDYPEFTGVVAESAGLMPATAGVNPATAGLMPATVQQLPELSGKNGPEGELEVEGEGEREKEGEREPEKPARPIPSSKSPALALYSANFNFLKLNDAQKCEIVETVSDLALWEKVCRDYALNSGWNPANIGKMLGYYRAGGRWPDTPGKKGESPPGIPRGRKRNPQSDIETEALRRAAHDRARRKIEAKREAQGVPA